VSDGDRTPPRNHSEGVKVLALEANLSTPASFSPPLVYRPPILKMAMDIQSEMTCVRHIQGVTTTWIIIIIITTVIDVYIAMIKA
jgi:hypothetical protein